MTTTRSTSRKHANNTKIIIFEPDHSFFPILKNEIIMQNSLCAEKYKSSPYTKNNQTVTKTYQRYSLNQGKKKQRPNLVAIVVAFQNDRIVGFQTLHHKQKGILKIDVGCVDVHRRGSLHGNINVKLTQSTRKWAILKKYSILILEGLPSAEGSWKRQGFKRVESMNNINSLLSNSNKTSTLSKINIFNKSIGKCTLRDGCIMFSFV